jgi:hypothetical protein
LSYSVTAAHLILVQLVQVRILVGQQHTTQSVKYQSVAFLFLWLQTNLQTNFTVHFVMISLFCY